MMIVRLALFADRIVRMNDGRVIDVRRQTADRTAHINEHQS
ncbi:MAG: hypothetical protein WCR59_13310 [Planctomycetota bacterium]|jgi:hypothetical protein